jgi:hypothetical protein
MWNSLDEKNYEKRMDVVNEPYFVLKAKNGEIIGTSEMYSSEQARDHGILAVRYNGVNSIIKDKTAWWRIF